MKNYKLLADSSFYICFLDDINRPDILLKLINQFDFITTPKLRDEIQKSKNYSYIQDNPHIKPAILLFDFGEILKPFFSKEEIRKGEHEIIAYAYILYKEGGNFYLILDDEEARNFVKNNFPYLVKLKLMMGTVKFIGLCCCLYKFLKKEETLILLNQIEKSKFRIKKYILDQIKRYVKGCKNVC